MVAGARIAVNVSADHDAGTYGRPEPSRNRLAQLRKGDFQISVRSPPDQRQACHPVFPVDCLPRPSVIFGWQNPGMSWDFAAGLLTASATGSNLDRGVVADSFHFSHSAASHHVEFLAVFSKPNRRRYFFSALAHRGQGNIFLTPNRRWYRFCHICGFSCTASRSANARAVASGSHT
jgi:hypothetical protein